MSDQNFAAWVEPIAAMFSQQRADLVDLVQSVPVEAWGRPSPNEGWTYRDLLGHVATRDPRDRRLVLNAVITKTRLDPAQLPAEEDVPINDRLLDQVRDASVGELAERLEEDTEEILDLLSQLTDEHQQLKQREFPMSLSEALRQMPEHERMHMEQLRTALEERS